MHFLHLQLLKELCMDEIKEKKCLNNIKQTFQAKSALLTTKSAVTVLYSTQRTMCALLNSLSTLCGQ